MSVSGEGERQVAPTIDGIRRDHVERYKWAAKYLQPGSCVLDLACGVGYGASILAEAGHTIIAVDRSQEAIDYARMHYARAGVTYICASAELFDPRQNPVMNSFDAIVSFETIEHLRHPEPILKKLRDLAPLLIASVPNDAVFPHGGRIKHHFRHYRPFEFKELLESAGYDIETWCGQTWVEGYDANVVKDHFGGRTLIAVAKRREANVIEFPEQLPTAVPVSEVAAGDVAKPTLRTVPKHVSIVGLGPSDAAYLDTVKRLGGRKAYCDETWVINAHGQVLDADLCFHMDDVRVQEIRAKARPDTNIARMLDWLKTHPGPIMTSRAHPDYPGLVEFPLEDVLNKLGYDYFNSTAAYAIAYAIFIGVEKLSLWGFDFTYPSAHDAEKGRGCCEYWIGVAMARGIKIAVPKTSTLLDAYVPADRRLYGYDTVNVKVVEQPDQSVKVEFTERETLPSAEEIERAYDHSRHPSADLPTVA